MRINHNIAALNTHRQMGINSGATQKSLEKLSSGLQINRAGDNAAGLAISEKMRGQIRGLGQASKNAQDSISLIQTGEGALNETQSILQRMRELAVQSGTDTNTAQDRTNIQSEMTALNAEVDRIASTTEFNTKKLLDGSLGKAISTAVANVNVNGALNANTAAAPTVSVAIAATTLLTALTDKPGNNLGIANGDTLTINYQVNGTTYSVTVAVSTSTDIASVVAAISTGNANVSGSVSTVGLQINAGVAGFAAAVNGITVTLKDSLGNIRNAATNAFSSFAQTTAAANAQADGTATFQIGANAGQTIGLNIAQADSAGLGIAGIQVTTVAQSAVSVKSLDAALQSVSSARANLGAVQNRLEHTIANLDTSSENLQSSESRIRDVDMAKEMMNFTKNNILSQASQAMLAQANQQPQGVLSLLR